MAFEETKPVSAGIRNRSKPPFIGPSSSRTPLHAKRFPCPNGRVAPLREKRASRFGVADARLGRGAGVRRRAVGCDVAPACVVKGVAHGSAPRRPGWTRTGRPAEVGAEFCLP